MRLVKIASATATLLLVGACASPRIPVVEPGAGVALPADYFAGARPEPGLDEVWWKGFRDPTLDALVDRALLRNQSIEAARQRLAAARAIVLAETSDFVPTVDGELAGDASFDDG